MAVRHGYGKIAGTDALVFAYDTGDTRNSYKGEPTENLVPSGGRTGDSALPRQSYHIRPWTYSIETNVAGRKGNVLRLYIDPPGTDSTAPYADYGFYAYKSGGSQVGDVYTISMDYYVVKGNSNPAITIAYANGYKNPTSSQAASWGSAQIIDLGGGWYRRIQSATITTAGNTWWRGGLGSNNIETEAYIDNIQIELKSHATPFVNGTRSATEGLKDLTGNSSIDLSNVTFDSNAQLTFDGTSDYVDLGTDLTISPNNQGWTAEYVFNTNSASTLQHFNSAEADDFNANWLALLSSKLAVWDHGQGTWKYGNTQFSSNTWYHVAFVQTSSTTMQFYVNGEAEGGDHTSFSWSPTYSALKTRYVGRYEYNGSYSRYFNGEISITKLYNRALTADEVRNNYRHYKKRFNI